MGEGVSGHITKGSVNRKVDALVNATDAAGKFHKRETFLTAIKNAANSAQYLTVLRDQAGITLEQSNYLRDTWYEVGSKGFWPWLQPVYPILVRGLIKAIEEAGDNLPLETYWSPGGDQVEVFVGRSAKQVTRLILTPGTMPPKDPRTTDLDLWIIRRSGPGEQPGRQTLDSVVEEVNGDVVTWRVRDV